MSERQLYICKSFLSLAILPHHILLA